MFNKLAEIEQSLKSLNTKKKDENYFLKEMSFMKTAFEDILQEKIEKKFIKQKIQTILNSILQTIVLELEVLRINQEFLEQIGEIFYFFYKQNKDLGNDQQQYLAEMIEFKLTYFNSQSHFILTENEETDFDLFFIILNQIEIYSQKTFNENLLQYFINIELDNDELLEYEKNEYLIMKHDLIIQSLFLKQYTTSEHKTQVFSSLIKYLKKMYFPVYFSDFLISQFESNKIDNKIIALDCLIILISKQQYEFEDFYTKIYKILQMEYILYQNKQLNLENSFFQSKFSFRFVKILELSLKSQKLSLNVTCSFLKLILQIILRMKSNQSILLSIVVFNIYQKREEIKNFFKIDKKFSLDQDKFNYEESLFENNITQSCFWETRILQKHFLNEIRTIFQQIQQNQIQIGDINLKDFQQIDKKILIKEKLKKIKINQFVNMNYQITISPNQLQSIEIAFENFIGYVKPGITEQQMLNYLMIFENLKVFLKLKQYFIGNDIHQQDQDDKQLEIFDNKLNINMISQLWKNDIDIFPFINNSLQILKNIEKQDLSIQQSQIEYLKNKKIVIPLELNSFKIQKKFSAFLMLSEILYIIRPLIHCYSQKISTSKSYKSYFINIYIDILWIVFMVVSEGFVSLIDPVIKTRIYNCVINYMLRNPFYEQILKTKVLQRIFQMIFGQGKIFNLISNILSFRSSLSYVMQLIKIYNLNNYD